MGTINAVRLININYNNGGIRINDETFNLNGESTLLSLQNGGGKSVLVQMMTAPFVHKNYRNAKDRPFAGYFTGSKPSFILIEWILDGGAGRLMNGFMIRKNPDDTGTDGENHDELEITSIISAYRGDCEWDIRHLPVVEKTKKEMNLKNYGVCRQIFDGFKKDRQSTFFYYDMNHGVQQRQYFDKLREYKIDCREWENIIKKVNLKEGGLIDLFSDCRDEKGLTEKWFLDAVEKKLDIDGTRMRDFARIMESHARQCFENADKIKRRDDIGLFKQYVASEEDDRSVRSLAGYELQKEQQKNEQTDKIVTFFADVSDIRDATNEEIEQKKADVLDLSEQVQFVKYEKYSAEIHALTKEEEKAEKALEITLMEMNSLEREIAELNKNLSIIEILRADDVRKNEYKYKEEIKGKLETLRRKEEELTPRRKVLGKKLYYAYRSLTTNLEVKINGTKEKITEKTNQLAERLALIKETEDKLSKTEWELGRLDSEVKSFDRIEDDYNFKFQTQYRRNILGRYEEGFLQVEKAEAESRFTASDSEVKNSKMRLDKVENLERKLESDLSLLKIRRNSLQNDIENAEKTLKNLNDQLDVRKDILSYLHIPEESVFDTTKIFASFDEKIRNIQADLRHMEAREKRLDSELNALLEGKVAELPESMERLLKNCGVGTVFGMEWLKKNGKKLSDNLELVRKNPFLPYALVVTEEELRRLNKADDKAMTSMPLPIILRTDLEKGIGALEPFDSAVVEFESLRFYIRFNEELLDEEGFKRIIGLKRDEINKLNEQLENRREELDEYIRKREIIRQQTVNREELAEATDKKDELSQNLVKTEEEITTTETQREDNRRENKTLSERIKELEALRSMCSEQLRELSVLMERYARYTINLDKKSRLVSEKEKLCSRKEMNKEAAEKDRGNIYSLDGILKNLEAKLNVGRARTEDFSTYIDEESEQTDNEVELLPEDEMEGAEAEYNAITDGVSGELSSVEEELSRQTKRYNDSVSVLERHVKNSGVQLDEARESDVTQADEDRFSKRLAGAESNLKTKERQYHKEDKNISVLKTEIKNAIKQMKDDTGNDEVLPAESIVTENFEEKIRILKHEISEIEKVKDALSYKVNSYQSILAALSDYEGIEPSGQIVFEENFAVMDGEELRKFLGLLTRTHKKLEEEQQKLRNKLADRLSELILKEEFADDYYRKPLEAMARSVDTPSEVLRQIDITVQAYDDLMRKIDVDLRMIEKERESIQTGLIDYIRDVNIELNKIDSNSTIEVRDRSLKMLMITIPSWQENEEIYKLRVRDYVEDVTKKCMELQGKSENIGEYIGTRINIRELYDMSVGISNVQIRLYKIEKQREYPISWAEVSKNSGGEGFLSTFVILSSLLHYIRRDDNDVFADKNEGKVLLMDNPFGITYSEHLLKPMMEIAKKNHTQLICLSGLGGESIYGRFDNIYVLSLVTASLRSGMQYLKSDHKKGSDPEVIIPSHIEVLGQQTLF